MFQALMSVLNGQISVGWLVVLAVASGLIEISPIKINPWSAIGKLFGLSGQIDKLYERVDGIGKQVNTIEVSRAEDKEISKKNCENICNKINCLEEQVNLVEDKVNKVDTDAEEQKAVNARVRILHFGDEILHHQQHTKEHFEQTLKDIKVYNTYCDKHPEFENNITVANNKIILEAYQDCLSGKSSFLPYYTNEEETKQ